jgi:hypothetical protein
MWVIRRCSEVDWREDHGEMVSWTVRDNTFSITITVSVQYDCVLIVMFNNYICIIFVVYSVLCLIVVPLPPDKHLFAVNNNNNNNNNNNKISVIAFQALLEGCCTFRISLSCLFSIAINLALCLLKTVGKTSLDGWSALTQGQHRHSRTRTDSHASSEIPTHDPSVWKGQDRAASGICRECI